MKSRIAFKNGKPFICVDGMLHAPLAYTTYFEECGTFSDFIRCGYKMFFVNVSFTDLPINTMTGFSPFETGVFETDAPDYTAFDSTVTQILAECPDALIFPRINISMPRRWIENNPDETVVTPMGIRRESLYSDAFRRDGADLLRALVTHIRTTGYADNIAGYQLCGGLTQEWMHFDFFGSFSEQSLAKFRTWMQKKYGQTEVEFPVKDDFNCPDFNLHAARYGEFCCENTANTVAYFAKVLKDHIHNEQIVGVFYGYNAFVNDYMLGLLGLRYIIDSPYIDFFSSPCCYDNNRAFGIDWGDMLTEESVRKHGKLYFVECDIRTHRTRRMQDSRPGRYRDDIYTLADDKGNKTVWCGPETPSLSLSAIRKAFAHQITKGSGIWWFDMWGGWFRDEAIMRDMQKMKQIADAAEQKPADRFPSAETVLFIDEEAYLNNPRLGLFRHCVNHTRVAMGNTGIPFRMCLTGDAPRIPGSCKAAVFTAPIPSQSGKDAALLCKKMQIPCLLPSSEKPFYTTDELRHFLIKNGIHCYDTMGNVAYCGNGFAGIHAAEDGEVQFRLPAKYRVKSLFGETETDCETDVINLHMKKHDTVVFELL